MKSWLFCLGLVSASVPAQGTPTPAPRAKVPAFDPAALAPYFSSGPAAEADRRLRARDNTAAARLFSDYLHDHPRAPDSQRARFLLGLAQLRDDLHDVPGPAREAARRDLALSAARNFDLLAGKYTLLDNYHRLYAARAYLLGNHPKEALDRARKVQADSILDCEARFLRGEALLKLGQKEPALGEYAAYLGGCEGGRKHEVQARMAELDEALGRPEEAGKLWRELYLGAPTESYGALSERHLGEADKGRFTAKELLGRAQVLFDNMRNPESEAAYRQVLALPGLPGDLACVARFHLGQSVFKQRQRPRAAPIFDEAALACGPAGAKNEDLHMKALYQSARCHGSKGELQAAADLFAQAEAAHPGHSYADDARLRQAEMYADLADKLQKAGPAQTCQQKTCPDYEARTTALLGDLPERYPGGDQRAEALWRLSFGAYRKKDYDKARHYLEESLRRVPRESGWDQEGRTLYWLGRLTELSGDKKGALTYYRRAAVEYPLSYYSLLSFNRLRESMPAELARLLDELTREPDGEETEWRFQGRALFGEPGFLRGVELARLGLGPEARQELSAVGIRVPEGKGAKVTTPAEEELLWLAAVLYDRAGEWHLSHWIPRHTLQSYQRRYPVGEARKQWELSYPRGYAELLVEAARKNGQPEALQFAIVREESAFDTLNESFANAIGLTQMIPPTAKRFSAGLPTTREALRDPAINVAIGARFLGFLWSTMQGNPVLSVAGYNAGEGAVFRWQKDRGDMDLDAWVEAIPYDETRGYTKRVLSSYLTYSWLTPGGTKIAERIPVVPLRPPALPVAKKAAKEEDPHRK